LKYSQEVDTLKLQNPLLLMRKLRKNVNILGENDKVMAMKSLEAKIILTFLLITNLTHFFHVFVYFISLNVSSITVLIIRRSNCINASSGMISLCK